MTYSPDLRSRVLTFVKQGGSKVEASERFGVHRLTIYNWLRHPNPPAKVRRTRRRKLDRERLRRHVQAHPDALLRERAAHFKVHTNAVWFALQHMDMSVKKNTALSGKKPRKAAGLSAKSPRHR